MPDEGQASATGDASQGNTPGTGAQGTSSTPADPGKGTAPGASAQGTSATPADSAKGSTPVTSDQGKGSTPADSGRGLSKDEEIELAKKLARTWASLIVLFGIGICVLVRQCGSGCITGAALIWALACLAIGYIGGFLFAVPRVPRTSAPSEPSDHPGSSGQKPANSPANSGGLGINTNLTEISDWLTKIIVGLGLVQLRKMPDYIRRMGAYVGLSLQSSSAKADQDAINSMASGLVLYFTALGFVSGYLLTRMFLSPAFRLADLATTTGIDTVARKIADSASQAASSAAATAQTAVEKAIDAMKAVVEEAKVNSAISTAMEELNRRPLQQASIDRLIGQLSGYRSRFPTQRRLAIVLGRLYAEGKSQYDPAINVLQGFINAINAKTQTDPTARVNVADAFFNIGCYYSKKMEQDKDDPDKVRTDGEKSIEAIDQSLKFAPQNAKDVNTDPDFEAVRTSPDFKSRVQELINAAGPATQQS